MVVAEGFFIHKRHEHIIRGGASVDVVIDVYIIIIILLNIVVVATKLRCNGFVFGRLRFRRSQQLFVAAGGGDDWR